MNCSECEELILEALETSMPESRQAELEAHLATCPNCRQFQQAQIQLDAVLVKSIQAPKLSPGFSARVLEQVDREMARTVPADVEARKRAAEAEFAAQMAQIEKGPFGLRAMKVLDLVGLGVAALLGGLLLSSLVSWLPSLPLPRVPAAGPGSLLYVSWAVAAAIVAAALTLGCRRDLLARLRV